MKVANYGEGFASLNAEYRFSPSLFPILDQDCGRVNRVLVLGGINLDEPSKGSTDLPLLQLDFTAKSELFEPASQKKEGEAEVE